MILDSFDMDLFVLGNGFDLFHGIPSGYDNFHEWLKSHKKVTFVTDMENFFPDTIVKRDNQGRVYHESTLWNRFEEALGMFDTETIFQYFTEDIEIDYDHPTQSTAAIEDAPEQFFEKLLLDMQDNFEQWVADINLSVVTPKPIKHFHNNGLYLCFNYTSTLEDVYDISRDQIEYIHGSASWGDHLVVGHCNHVNDIHDNDMPLYEETGRNNVIRLGNGLKKNTKEVIMNHWKFFQKINPTVDKVICYGHSYALVDDPYFEEIRKRVGAHAQWHLSWYKNEDLQNIQAFEKRLLLNPANCHPFKM